MCFDLVLVVANTPYIVFSLNIYITLNPNSFGHVFCFYGIQRVYCILEDISIFINEFNWNCIIASVLISFISTVGVILWENQRHLNAKTEGENIKNKEAKVYEHGRNGLFHRSNHPSLWSSEQYQLILHQNGRTLCMTNSFVEKLSILSILLFHLTTNIRHKTTSSLATVNPLILYVERTGEYHKTNIICKFKTVTLNVGYIY